MHNTPAPPHTTNTSLRSNRTIRLIAIAAAIVFVANFISCHIINVAIWVRYFSYIGIIVTIGGLLDVATMRVELDHSGLTMVSNIFNRRFFAKHTISTVSWEKGSGVIITLTDGKSIKLPSVGKNDQALAAKIRSWLKRPQSSSAHY